MSRTVNRKKQAFIPPNRLHIVSAKNENNDKYTGTKTNHGLVKADVNIEPYKPQKSII